MTICKSLSPTVVLTLATVAATRTAAAAPLDPPAAATSTASATAAPARLGNFGFGIRYGSTHVRLDAAGLDGVVEQLGGQGAANRIDDFDQQLRVFTPTFHIGGEGYFFKLELPIGTGPAIKTYGLGLYPLNIGYHFAPVGLFPYFSAGVVGNVIVGSPSGQAGAEDVGGLLQGRLALGLKWRPFGALTFSVEAGYSPYATGLLTSTQTDTTSFVRGGEGHVVDFSLGIELL